MRTLNSTLVALAAATMVNARIQTRDEAITYLDDPYRHAVKIPEITRRSRVKDYAPPEKSKFKKKPKFKGSKAARKAGRRK